MDQPSVPLSPLALLPLLGLRPAPLHTYLVYHTGAPLGHVNWDVVGWTSPSPPLSQAGLPGGDRLALTLLLPLPLLIPWVPWEGSRPGLVAELGGAPCVPGRRSAVDLLHLASSVRENMGGSVQDQRNICATGKLFELHSCPLAGSCSPLVRFHGLGNTLLVLPRGAGNSHYATNYVALLHYKPFLKEDKKSLAQLYFFQRLSFLTIATLISLKE